MAKDEKKDRYFVQSDLSDAEVRKILHQQGIDDKDIETVELWVRSPEDPKFKKAVMGARLCGCSNICIEPPPPPPCPPVH